MKKILFPLFSLLIPLSLAQTPCYSSDDSSENEVKTRFTGVVKDYDIFEGCGHITPDVSPESTKWRSGLGLVFTDIEVQESGLSSLIMEQSIGKKISYNQWTDESGVLGARNLKID